MADERARTKTQTAPAGGAKIKSKVVRSTIEYQDVLDLFHGALGDASGAGANAITHAKYLRIAAHVERFLKLLRILDESELMALFPDMRARLAAYRAALAAQHAASFCAPDLCAALGVAPSALEIATGSVSAETFAGADYDRLPADVAARFAEAFAAVKGCSLVNTAVVVCNNLGTHRVFLSNGAALNDKFLMGAGSILCPLPDLPLNFKQIYIDDRLTADHREFVLVILHKLYTIGHDVYEAVSAPDVDVAEFAKIIMSSIDEVKKQIPRCDAAFAKIAESVDLLRSNFGSYHKDYVASGNPTIIMENFVLDVAKDTKSSPAVTNQFRRIISHYRKLAASQGTNPKLQGLFQQVDKNFQELDRQNSKGAGAGAGEGEGEAEAEGAEPPTGLADAPAAAADAPPTRAKKAGRTNGNRRERRAKAAAANAALAAAAAAGDDGQSLAAELDGGEEPPAGGAGQD